MRVSREQVAENRRRILEAAGRLFRERGFEAVTVAEVMKAAGLTHGGFYGHFKSKDDLIAQTLAHMCAGPAGGLDLLEYAGRYLTAERCRDFARGCPTATLGPDCIRQSGAARATMTDALKAQIERLAEGAPGGAADEKRRAAIGSWAAMVGAMILARMADEETLSEEILQETRAWIEQAGRACAGTEPEPAAPRGAQ